MIFNVGGTSDSGKYLPLSGGIVNGDVTVKADDTSQRVHALQNSLRRVFQTIAPSGNYNLYDGTNSKPIIVSTLDGTNTFNGTASGNLSLTGGTLNGIPYFGDKKKFISWHNNDLMLGVYNGENDTSNSTRFLVGNSNEFGIENALLLMRYVNGTPTSYPVIHTGNMADHVLPNTGGTVNGSVRIESDKTDDMQIGLSNSARNIFQRGTPSGNYYLYDNTHNTHIIRSLSDGTNTFNGKATGNGNPVHIGTSAPSDTTALWIYTSA